ncbi:MAG: hypothetical protein GW893_24545 [Armatimonadetes bacterium]|nr:hypothetical protein [Armatimonadota bacterium]
MTKLELYPTATKSMYPPFRNSRMHPCARQCLITHDLRHGTLFQLQAAAVNPVAEVVLVVEVNQAFLQRLPSDNVAPQEV